MSISPSSRQRKAWDLNPHNPRRVARPEQTGPAKPYPATFRMSVDPPGIEPGFPVCRTGVVPLDHEPMFTVDRRWESNPDYTDLARTKSSSHWYDASPIVARGLSGNRTRSPSLPRTCAAGTPTDHRVSDPGWTRTIVFLVVTQVSSPLDYRIMSSVTEVGVEPTKSPSSRPGRFACLRTPVS